MITSFLPVLFSYYPSLTAHSTPALSLHASRQARKRATPSRWEIRKRGGTKRIQKDTNPLTLVPSKPRILPPPPLSRTQTMGQNLPQVVVLTRSGPKLALLCSSVFHPVALTHGSRILRKVEITLHLRGNECEWFAKGVCVGVGGLGRDARAARQAQLEEGAECWYKLCVNQGEVILPLTDYAPMPLEWAEPPAEDDCLPRPEAPGLLEGNGDAAFFFFFSCFQLCILKNWSWQLNKPGGFSQQLSKTVRWCLLIENGYFISPLEKKTICHCFNTKRGFTACS